MTRSNRSTSRHDQRGTGAATALLAEAERLVHANGHDQAWLAVVAGNARARRFYERNHWIDTGPFDYPAEAGDGEILIPCHRYVKRAAGPVPASDGAPRSR